MNKKNIMFGVLFVFALALVSAAVILYSVSQSVTVNPSFTFVGDNAAPVIVAGGESVSSEDLSLDSDTSVIIPLGIETTPVEVGITHTEEYILSASGVQGTDSMVYISAVDAGVSTVGDLDTISWDANNLLGYASHVDVLIDTDSDGVVDDALVFEYAKVDASDCDDVGDYPTGEFDTFADKGTIGASSYAWLSSGPAGPCGDSVFDAGHKTLTYWKVLNYDIIGFDFEVDNWIQDSDTDLSNILINGASVEVSLKSEESLDFRVNTEFGLEVLGDYTIETTVDVR